jgi:hypothetical protein
LQRLLVRLDIKLRGHLLNSRKADRLFYRPTCVATLGAGEAFGFYFSFAADGTELTDYYCYALPVLAPATGVVHATYTDARDMPIGILGGMPPGGNQIIIKVAEKQFLFLCHLQPGSIDVQPGDKVEEGQVIARIGNSGNTSEPHLHIHLQDTPDLFLGEGIPLYFRQYRVGSTVVQRGVPSGGVRRGQWIGQVIEHVGSSD